MPCIVILMWFELFDWLSTAAISLWANYGLIGLLVAGFLENATLFLGVPFEIVIALANSTNTYSPFVIAIVGGLGAACGELLGYLIGLGGRKAIEKLSKKDAKRMEDFKQHINQHGAKAIYIMCIIPIPFDLVGLASGLIKFDIKQFFLATWAGKATRYTIIGLAVVYGVKIILPIFGLS